MKPNLLHKSIIAGFMVLASGYSMQASALPLEPFTFNQSTGFLVDNTLLSTNGNNSIGWYQYASSPTPPAGEYNTIAWGVPITTSGGGLLATDPITPDPGSGNINTDLSGLRVIGHQGTITTGAALGNGSDWGGWETITTLYHQNRAIRDTAYTLLNAVIKSTLTFGHIPEGDFPGDVNSVGISFNETLNAGSCPNGNPNGSICDDLFKFGLTTFAPISFTFGLHTYQVEFGLGNFINSSTNFPTCPGGDCTIWTAENVTSSMDVLARIRQVPEPATLALIGLGLLGIGFVKRRSLMG